jgi:hypothetical protein
MIILTLTRVTCINLQYIYVRTSDTGAVLLTRNRITLSPSIGG